MTQMTKAKERFGVSHRNNSLLLIRGSRRVLLELGHPADLTCLAPFHNVRDAEKNGRLVLEIQNSAPLILAQDILVETPVGRPLAFSGTLHGIFRKSQFHVP